MFFLNHQIFGFPKLYIAILNDSTRYQAEPGNAVPEALPRL
jgi:hypothetical protein